FAARGPVLAAPPLVPVTGRGNAAAEELVEHIADQPLLLETGRRIIEALLLELPLDVLQLAPPCSQDLQPLALLAAFLFLFAQPGTRLVDLGDDPVVLAGAGHPRFGQQCLD